MPVRTTVRNTTRAWRSVNPHRIACTAAGFNACHFCFRGAVERFRPRPSPQAAHRAGAGSASLDLSDDDVASFERSVECCSCVSVVARAAPSALGPGGASLAVWTAKCSPPQLWSDRSCGELERRIGLVLVEAVE
jgi:hypothetical protein